MASTFSIRKIFPSGLGNVETISLHEFGIVPSTPLGSLLKGMGEASVHLASPIAGDAKELLISLERRMASVVAHGGTVAGLDDVMTVLRTRAGPLWSVTFDGERIRFIVILNERNEAVGCLAVTGIRSHQA